jgi:ubiquinol-cytochrome c reductase cytochrome c1 subunit
LQFGPKVFEQTSLTHADAEHWFGRAPPDLSLMVALRGRDWLIAYLEGFYTDTTQLFGSNNQVSSNTRMPDPFYALRAPQYSQQRRELIIDIADFLTEISDPNRTLRHRLGWVVCAFLVLLSLVIYVLKRLYWRDIKA